MANQQSHVHHYVPQWYQKRFMRAGQFEYYYLDLQPDVIEHGGQRHQMRALRRWGTGRSFCKDDLYTLKLGAWTTDQIEKQFFGIVDVRGREAVAYMSDYATHQGLSEGARDAFRWLPAYMDAQRSRTPRALDQLRKRVDLRDTNQTLLFMRSAFQFQSTMWMEGVWEIVSAALSPTKFIVTDEPVTFFNRRAFPSELAYPEDASLAQVGTRTLFPLSLDTCLIITHVQLAREPRANPTESRVNARAYQPTLKKFTDTQFGRELTEEEVLRINYILKRRATRYIAAAEEEWLYPERHVSTGWSKLDDDWFLFPHLYKVPFTSEIIVGYKDGSVWAMDEYGRNPGHPGYRDKARHSADWISHGRARIEWAKKRTGKSMAHVIEFEGDAAEDRVMEKDLATTSYFPSQK
jgi:Protein of unknown function (DUF4238)